MNLEVKDVVKLSDGKKYVVCNKINYQNRNYYLLIDYETSSIVKVCFIKKTDENKTYVTLVNGNDSLLIKLLKLFDAHKVD